MTRRRRALAVLLFLAFALAAVAVLGSVALVRHAARGRTYSDLRFLPHRDVGLVLGCAMRLPDGAPNPFFVDRIAAAEALYRAGKVDRLLVSGESHTGYNEAADMRAALLRDGISAANIEADPAGVRTLDSVVRAKEVFGHTQMIIVSQPGHLRRAIFLASHRGIDAIGYEASTQGVQDKLYEDVREHLADLRAVLDILLRTQPRERGKLQ